VFALTCRGQCLGVVSYLHIHKIYICSFRALSSSVPPFLCTTTQNVGNHFCDFVGVTAGFVLTERSFILLVIYIDINKKLLLLVGK